jgi:hypothetical protein
LGSPSASTLSSWPLSQTLTSLATTRRIANKFPVIKLANEAVDPVRRRASRELPWCGERRKIAKNLHLSQRHQGTEKDIKKSWTPSGIPSGTADFNPPPRAGSQQFVKSQDLTSFGSLDVFWVSSPTPSWRASRASSRRLNGKHADTAASETSQPCSPSQVSTSSYPSMRRSTENSEEPPFCLHLPRPEPRASRPFFNLSPLIPLTSFLPFLKKRIES